MPRSRECLFWTEVGEVGDSGAIEVRKGRSLANVKFGTNAKQQTSIKMVKMAVNDDQDMPEKDVGKGCR